MDSTDVQVVLATLAGLDPRHIPPTERAAVERAEAWARTLGAEPAVPLGFALDFIDHAYRKYRAEPVQVGDIRSAWITRWEREEARRLSAERRRLSGRRGSGMPEYLRRQMLADVERSREQFEADQRAKADARLRAHIEKASA